MRLLGFVEGLQLDNSEKLAVFCVKLTDAVWAQKLWVTIVPPSQEMVVGKPPRLSSSVSLVIIWESI